MDPFVGEIRAVAFSFAPKNWALCNGQILPIAQNTALFSILGVNYGGDGRTTFGLPNLQARFPIGAGGTPPNGLTEVSIGEAGGAASVTLSYQEMPSHTHRPRAVAANGDSASPVGAVWAQGRTGRAPDRMYDSGAAAGSMGLRTSPAGGGAAHNNLPPFLVVNFIIALSGIFPQRPY